MGKGTIVGIIILVPAVLCSAAAYVTGMQIEEGWQASITDSGFRENIKNIHYERGIFTSRAGGCVDLNSGGEQPPLDVCYVVDIAHGPLVLDGATLLPRLATFDAQMDTSGAGMGAQMLRGLFDDPQPLRAQAQVFFNGRTEFSVNIKPFELDSPFFQISAAGLSLDGWVDQSDAGSASQLIGSDIYIGLMDEFQLSMPSINSTWQQRGQSGSDLPMGKHRLSAPEVFIGLGQSLGNYTGSMDVLAAVDTRMADGLADSSVGVWLDNMALDGSAVTGLYAGYDASGVNVDAALRLRELLSRHGQSGSDDPQVVADHLLAWAGEFRDVVGDLLDRKGQIQTKLVFEDEEGPLIGFTGRASPRSDSAKPLVDGDAPSPLMALAHALDTDTTLYLAPAALYGADAELISLLVDNGVLKKQRDASYAVRLQTRNGGQWLNGEAVVPERLAPVASSVRELMLPAQVEPAEPSP